MTRGMLAAVLACAPIALASVAPAAADTAALDLGGGARGAVVADPAAMLAAVDLAVRAGADRETPDQSGLAALAAACVLETNGLQRAVESRGAAVRFAVGVNAVRFSLDGPPDAVGASAPLVAAALAAPSFTAETLAAARATLAGRMKDGEVDAREVGRAMLRGSYYRGAAGLPPYGTAATLARFGPDDVRAFYAAWYRRGSSVAVAAGRTGPATDAAMRALVAALPDGAPAAAVVETKPFGAEPRRIVTQREVGAPVVVLGFAAPALGDRDFAAALVVRALLGRVLNGSGTEMQSPLRRASGAAYAYDAAPAQMTVWINGARTNPGVGLATLGTVVKAAGEKPLTPAVLDRYKAAARGEWILETIGVDERAGAAANALLRGLPPDEDDVVSAAIGNVTSADVQRVARTYFQNFDVALVLPRGTGN